MSTAAETPATRIGLGMTSLVLGTIGLFLFFLPVLGVPLSAAGLALGLIAALVAVTTGQSSLRWSVAGVAMAGLALGVNVAVATAPEGYLTGRRPREDWRPPPGGPRPPPPQRPAAPPEAAPHAGA
jgi:hypothetical protein